MIMILFLLLLSFPVFSQNNYDKNLTLVKSDVGITIDGFIDDTWQSADSADGFTQFQPYNGKESQRRTVVKLITTRNLLYTV